VPPAGAGPVGAVARSLAATFTTELARHGVERPRPIPVTFRPLATAIVGDRPVHVSTGTASRRALAAVGKRAATTGDTIHLATPAPTTEVIAHELTHVAHPSPTPRFFDDDVRDPEERRAEQVAAIMRRTPVLPRTTAATDTIRRSPASTAGTVSAADLAARLTGAAAGAGVIQRVIGGHRARTQPATFVAQPPVITQPDVAQATQSPAQPGASSGSQAEDASQFGAAAAPDLTTQFDRILELLEDRILRELERRGGRFRGGF
jgi:Domain of unknown function (DUF4157)